ncbi:unnamed protein product, partial [Mesorhabditis spiculigera]
MGSRIALALLFVSVLLARVDGQGWRDRCLEGAWGYPLRPRKGAPNPKPEDYAKLWCGKEPGTPLDKCLPLAQIVDTSNNDWKRAVAYVATTDNQTIYYGCEPVHELFYEPPKDDHWHSSACYYWEVFRNPNAADCIYLPIYGDTYDQDFGGCFQARSVVKVIETEFPGEPWDGRARCGVNRVMRLKTTTTTTTTPTTTTTNATTTTTTVTTTNTTTTTTASTTTPVAVNTTVSTAPTSSTDNTTTATSTSTRDGDGNKTTRFTTPPTLVPNPELPGATVFKHTMLIILGILMGLILLYLCASIACDAVEGKKAKKNSKKRISPDDPEPTNMSILQHEDPAPSHKSEKA